ncbi:MAG: unspecific monooxygenase [Halocynthiibacter sp.]|jgi:cytochrome P450
MSQLPIFSQSPTAPDFVQNPYDFYAKARASGPMIFWQDYDLPCATSFDAVNAGLRDSRFGREALTEFAPQRAAHTAPFYAVEAHSMLELEPPRHRRLRSLVLRAFTSRRIRELAPEIEALCADLIAKLPGDGFDILTEYAQPIPVIVIARLLGVPEAMAPQLLQWSAAMVGMYQARRSREMEEAAAAAATAFCDFLRSYVEERRSAPSDDLISHLIAAEEDGEKLSTDELISTCILLLNAGHEATVHSLGNALKTILETGTRAAFLDPQTRAGAIEEALRFDPPLHMFTRYAYEDMRFFGCDLKRGDQIALLLGSANRDEEAFHRADQFDPLRPLRANTSFGAGIHFCVGAPLARLEMSIAIPALLNTYPNLALKGTPRYGDVYHFHGLEALNLRA